MKVANEKVWETADGKLVKDGDPKAATLVASKGHPMPDKKLERFGKDADAFFTDATFDRAGALKPAEQLKQPAPVRYARLDAAGPSPENREEAMPAKRTRAAAKKSAK